MASIRWGIIGCGDVTEKKSGSRLSKGRSLATRCGDAAGRRQSGGLCQTPRCPDAGTTMPTTLIADPEVDAVYIATPPDSHKYYALACAAAGKPVLVEKPLALTGADADEMVAACCDRRGEDLHGLLSPGHAAVPDHP